MMPLHEATVYLSMVCVLFGLYKGDKGWGRSLLGISFLLLVVQLVMYADKLCPDVF